MIARSAGRVEGISSDQSAREAVINCHGFHCCSQYICFSYAQPNFSPFHDISTFFREESGVHDPFP